MSYPCACQTYSALNRRGCEAAMELAGEKLVSCCSRLPSIAQTTQQNVNLCCDHPLRLGLPYIGAHIAARTMYRSARSLSFAVRTDHRRSSYDSVTAFSVVYCDYIFYLLSTDISRTPGVSNWLLAVRAASTLATAISTFSVSLSEK